MSTTKLDEGLEILVGLLTGEPFGYKGDFYKLEEMVFLPAPVQTPRIPIWVGGTWSNKRPIYRAAKYDGYFPGCGDGSSGARGLGWYLGSH